MTGELEMDRSLRREMSDVIDGCAAHVTEKR